MKIAYVINGLVGGLSGKNFERKDQDCISEITKYCKSTIDTALSDHDVDFYIFSWHRSHAEELDKIFRPKRSSHQEQKRFVIPRSIENSQRSQNHFSRWYSFCQAINMLEEDVNKGESYDFVINARFDVCWNRKVTIETSKFLCAKYVAVVDKDNVSYFEETFNLDVWPNTQKKTFELLDMPDHVFGGSFEQLKKIKSFAENIRIVHEMGCGRGPMMSHHRLLPGMMKLSGIKHDDLSFINYIEHYRNLKRGLSDYDIFRHHELTKEELCNSL